MGGIFIITIFQMVGSSCLLVRHMNLEDETEDNQMQNYFVFEHGSFSHIIKSLEVTQYLFQHILPRLTRKKVVFEYLKAKVDFFYSAIRSAECIKYVNNMERVRYKGTSEGFRNEEKEQYAKSLINATTQFLNLVRKLSKSQNVLAFNQVNASEELKIKEVMEKSWEAKNDLDWCEAECGKLKNMTDIFFKTFAADFDALCIEDLASEGKVEESQAIIQSFLQNAEKIESADEELPSKDRH